MRPLETISDCKLAVREWAAAHGCDLTVRGPRPDGSGMWALELDRSGIPAATYHGQTEVWVWVNAARWLHREGDRVLEVLAANEQAMRGAA